MSKESNINKKNNQPKLNSGSSFGIGIGIGVALGVALDNIGVGIAIGVAIGAALSQQYKKGNDARILSFAEYGTQDGKPVFYEIFEYLST